ncbi:TlpA family protein disulfide reductase [Spirillospora sp. CA-294931]|uniref:TlpA family protein disulfide reductase n=1 Tax=Spirillospora sp. CA-294931 TaxID=3240042 RepID=UPI003D94EB7E
MPFLIAAVVLVGAVCLVDLVLTLGTVRRLRAHTALIEHLLSKLTSSPKTMLDAGERVGAFSALSTDGELITRESLTQGAETALVGFFSPDCDACREKMPDFIRRAEDSPGAIAVVVGQEAASKELVASFALQRVARLVYERSGESAMATAFGVKAFPAVGVVDETGVLQAGDDHEHDHDHDHVVMEHR